MSHPSEKAIHLGPDYHAEPGETKHHLWDVYTTKDVGENDRIHVGHLWKQAVDSWKNAMSSKTWVYTEAPIKKGRS